MEITPTLRYPDGDDRDYMKLVAKLTEQKIV